MSDKIFSFNISVSGLYTVITGSTVLALIKFKKTYCIFLKLERRNSCIRILNKILSRGYKSLVIQNDIPYLVILIINNHRDIAN